MKLLSFKRSGRDGWGVVATDRVVDMTRRFDGRFSTLRSALSSGNLDEIAHEVRASEPDFELSEIDWLPPIPDPDKIICFGLNYGAHVSEGGGDAPQFPSLFTRLTNTLVPHEGALVRPKLSEQLDYECELALVIGKAGRHIPVSDAMRYVAGYTCFNDASVRDYQLEHSLPAGKNFYATGGCGPWLVTRDEIPDPAGLQLWTRINGEEVQHGNTKDLIFAIPQLISYVSGFTPLMPGDIISTGTPEGVGFVREPPLWLKPGDIVEVGIDRIGILRNRVVAEGA